MGGDAVASGRARLGPGPVEPWTERFDVIGLDGTAAPDPQAWWRIAITGDVERGAFELERAGDLLDQSELRLLVKAADCIVRKFQAD